MKSIQEEIEGMKPTRIQRKRTKGWKMPKNTVYVGRPTKWGNPYKVAKKNEIGFTLEGAVWRFGRDYKRKYIQKINQVRKELKGKNLACWCPLDQPCHADVLLKIANS